MTTLVAVNERPREADSSGNQQSFRRIWEVQMSDGNGNATDAVGAVGVNPGDGHPENVFAVASKATAKQTDDVCFWEVEVEYRTYDRDYAEEEKWTVADPTERKVKVSVGWYFETIPVRTARNGDAIINSAGQYPESPLTVQQSNLTFRITANVPEIPDWIDTYRGRYGTCNAEPFRIQFQNGQYKEIEKGCAKLERASSSELKKENGVDFFELDIEIMIKDPPPSDPEQEGWCFDMYDMGMMELVENPDPAIGIVMELKPILGQDGQPIVTPWFLDGEGAAIPRSNGLGTGPGPKILYFDYLDPKDFTVIPGCSAAT